MRSWWCLAGEIENQDKNLLAAETGIAMYLELMVLLSVSVNFESKQRKL